MTEGRFRRTVVVASAVAALHGLAYVPFVSPHETPDSSSYLETASSILDASYSTPLHERDITGAAVAEEAQGQSVPQTYRTPGYPLLLTLVGGGDAGFSQTLLFFLQALLFGVTTFLTALTARRLWGPYVALFAAWTVALDPFSKRSIALVLSEVLAGALAMAAAYALVRAWQQHSARWWAATGALLGALSLVRPLFALAIPMAAVAALLGSAGKRQRLLSVAAVCLVSLLALAPWLAWTNSQAGKPVLASFGPGWNLLVGAHGEGLGRTWSDVESDPAYRRDFDSVHRLAPTAAELLSDPSSEARYLVAADDEQRRLAIERYSERVGEEPLAVVGDVLYRSYFLWMAHEEWYQPTGAALLPLRVTDWVILALAVAGAAMAARRRGPGLGLVLFLLTFTLVNGFHHVEARYSLPLRPLFLALASLAVVSALRRWSPRVATKWHEPAL